MRVLLFGAGGILGHDLAATAPADVELKVLAHAQLDVTDRDAVRQVMHAYRPTVVLNASGYTKVDQAETEFGVAHAVNGEAPGTIAGAAAAEGATVVHFSTDYVFDGTGTRPYREDDPPNPLSVYGRSKLAGEIALRESEATYLLLRTQWLFGPHGSSFPRTMWERAGARKATSVVADQTGRPTYTADLARATWQLLDSGATGVMHVANGGTATWFDVARLVFRRAGVEELVRPCTTADYPTAARRPRWSVLDTTRFEELAGHSLPPWDEALHRFLDAFATTPSAPRRTG